MDVPTSQDIESWWTPQAKLDLFHDTRQAYGRTSLLLQGGAIFGLSHLGVVKALYLRGLLPRIITGNATGALIAALVCIHTDDELLEFLSGDGIDLSAFDQNLKRKPTEDDESDLANKQFIPEYPAQLLDTLTRRIMRYVREGYFLDIEILADCAHTNLGEITFEEAYKRTKRILNITISTSGEAGVPTVLNYLTAPNVCIWSAALASNSSSSLYSPVIIYSKDENGNTVPWPTTENVTFNPNRQTKPASERESPLARIAELFNVNHFIVSQARPYIAPFLQSELHHPNPRFSDGAAALFAPCFRLMTSELHHRLKQLDTLGVLPASLGSLLLEETIPAASITLVPDITISDFAKLLENPTKENLEYWMLRGERAVWPAIDAITVRCGVEVKLDKCYHRVRLAKPLDGDSASVRKVGSKGSLAVLRLRSMGSWEGPSTRNHHQNGASGNRSSTNEQDEDDVTTVYDDEG